jgi:adenosylhomocysteinase
MKELITYSLSDTNSINIFFKRLKNSFKLFERGRSNIILVSHILPDKIPFINFLIQNTNLLGIIPKPNTINPEVYNYLLQRFKVRYIHCKRGEISSSKIILEILKDFKKVIIIDVGGYFSTIFSNGDLTDNILGVIEDTENGIQRYIKTYCKVPVIDIARSPLKYAEDLLVAESIVFSTEYLLRKIGLIYVNNVAGVIGFGKIGKNIARTLYTRNIRTLVYDKDPIKRIWASAYGYEVGEKYWLLKNSDIVFCATGNRSIVRNGLRHIKDNLKIASVTSSDDEFDSDLLSECIRIYSNKEWSLYKTKEGKLFYLLNHGNSINFLHNALVGNYILIVQGEILVALDYLIKNKERLSNKIITLPEDIKRKIARLWLKVFRKK